jgi:hypothetical protein
MSEIPISSESVRCIETLREQIWTEYWVQGGVFDLITPRTAGLYTIPSLTVFANEYISIGACAVENEEGIERMVLSLSFESEVGTASSERDWRPARRKVKEYPNDLNLGSLLNVEKEIDLLRHTEGGDSFFDAIIVTTNSSRLLLGADEHVPESVFLTENPNTLNRIASIRSRIRVGHQAIDARRPST